MCAGPNMAIFCQSLASCFLDMSLSDFEMVSFAQIVTGISLFSHHTCSEFLLYCLYILESFLITILSPEIARSVNIHIPSSLSRVMMSSLLLGMISLVCTTWCLNMVALTSRLCFNLYDYGTWSYQGSLSNFTPISLCMLNCSWAHTLSCLLMYLLLLLLLLLLYNKYILSSKWPRSEYMYMKFTLSKAYLARWGSSFALVYLTAMLVMT